MRMRSQGVQQSAPLVCGPDLYRLVMRGGVDVACAAPADAGDGAFVPAKDCFDTFGDDIPDSQCRVFG